MRLIAATTIAAFFIVAAAILAMRYWLLPDVENYRPNIERAVSQAIGERVAIGSIKADWKGIHPHLVMRDIRIFAPSGRSALTLERMENNLSWMTFLSGEIRFSSIEIDQPKLGIRRDRNGVIYIAGIPVNQGPSNQSMSDWLLHQNKILIKNGFILWEDEERGAPPLTVSAVDFALVNARGHHLFGLHAIPPAELSSPLDIRGNLYGNSLNDFKSWRGKLYARIDYADTAQLRNWLPSPDQLLAGRGAMRVWLDFSNARPEAFTADLILSDVRAKLGTDLPEMDMTSLRGRINWENLDGGFAIRTQKLALETMQGERIRPTDFVFRSVPAHDISPMEGELSVNSLDLAMLSRLSEHFPMPSKVREMLATLAPKGTVSDLQVKWEGETPASSLIPWQSPQKTGQFPEHYSLKGSFSNLGLAYSGNAVKNVSGHVDGDEKGGSFSLDSRHAQFSLAKVFASPITLDILTAQAKWHNDDQGIAVTFDNLSFSNADVAGNAFGTYKSAGNFADITGKLSRAEASQVWRYLPLVVAEDARNWVKNAIVGGRSDDVKFRLKGKLDDFPFANGNGIFQTSIDARDTTLRYAPGWPEMTSVSANILFKGAGMEITSRQGAILGAKLTSAQASIHDLDHPLLDIDGEAAGPTDEFLKFIEQSPVTHYIDGFTSGMHATGLGHLKIKLDIPLEKVENTRVAGNFQFLGNKVSGPMMPDIADLNGTLNFSDSSLDAKAVSATILGGPALINASTANDGSMTIAATGRINPDHASSAFARHFHGSSPWQAVISAGKKKTGILIASTLQGISSDLPYPFGKKASDSLPFRLERKAVSQHEDLVSISLGKILAAKFAGSADGGFGRIDRGTIQLDEDASAELPDAPGIWLVGSLESLDADAWHDILDGMNGGRSPVTLTGVDLDIGSLTFLGKQFGELSVSAKQRGGNWQASLTGDDIDGNMTWIPEGKGRLVAKLKKLVIPDEQEASQAKAVLAKASSHNLPALDITSDNFVLKRKSAGRLELVAVQQGSDWKIQKLRISNADSVLTADGLWQGWAIHPRTNINVKLDVSRIGKFLARFGYPDNIMRGRGSLEGTLSWAGSPQSINYATLNGNIVLKARHGQFNKIDPGIGKLLGILSLQALPRRITLDFRDIFSQGFVFDDISSSLAISDGIARTDDLRIVGPAAEVGMQGSVDLDKETQNLKVIVKPQIGSSFSVASSLLGGPVVGIATWVVGKVLQDPLDQLASYEYNVTGSWIDPIVTKVHE